MATAYGKQSCSEGDRSPDLMRASPLCKWMRGVAVFYGLITLALFGVVAFSQLGSSTVLWASADAGKPSKCQPTRPGASC
jgi:hypothetical protein